MEYLPPFFKSLTGFALIKAAVTKSQLSEDDLIGYAHIRADKNKIVIKDFYIGENNLLAEVRILMLTLAF